jgi:hypothetical protein
MKKFIYLFYGITLILTSASAQTPGQSFCIRNDLDCDNIGIDTRKGRVNLQRGKPLSLTADDFPITGIYSGCGGNFLTPPTQVSMPANYYQMSTNRKGELYLIPMNPNLCPPR